MMLERGESGNDLASKTESGNVIRHPLFRFWDNFENGLAQFAQCRLLALVQRLNIRVNFLFGHARSLSPQPTVVKGVAEPVLHLVGAAVDSIDRAGSKVLVAMMDAIGDGVVASCHG